MADQEDIRPATRKLQTADERRRADKRYYVTLFAALFALLVIVGMITEVVQ